MSDPSRNRFRLRDQAAPAWIIAHRGNSSRAPENTLEDARLGHAAGAEAWELDVRLTRDGVPVVLHDASLRRTTDVARRFQGDPRAEAGFLVADFDLEEVRALDAGGWFLDPAGGHRTASAFGTLGRLSEADRASYASGRVRVPTLEEALELTVGLDWLVNVELKSDFAGDGALVDVVLPAIGRAGALDRVLISSFDHEEVAQVARRCPSAATGILAPCPLYRPADYVRRAGADTYHPSASALGAESDAYRRSPSRRGLRRDDLDGLRRAGVPVFIYTVNDAAPGGLADHLLEAGAAGLFTDDPSAFALSWRPARG